MKIKSITSVSLASALLLGATLLTGCNKSGEEANSTAADTTTPAADQPATDTTGTASTAPVTDTTGTASTAPMTTSPTDTTGATTMGNADTGSDMSGTGTGSDMNATGANGADTTGATPPQDNGQNGTDQNPNPPPTTP